MTPTMKVTTYSCASQLVAPRQGSVAIKRA